MLDALISAGLQLLEPAPEVAERGEVVEIRAVDGSGRPIDGLAVEVLKPDGTLEPLGVTDAEGVVEFEASVVGEHLIRGEVPESGGPPGPATQLWTPYHVVAERRRWLWAIACVPLGLVLLWSNLRRLRGRNVPAS